MNQIYFIKTINALEQKGWIIDSSEHEGGFAVSTKVHPNMTQFVSFDAAEVFIVKKRLRKNGIKAYIIGDEELLDQEKEIIGISVKPLDVDVYYIENDKEEKLYYNVENDSYFFQAGIIGFAFWYTEQEATTAKDVFATAGTVKKIDKAPASDN